MDFYQIVSQLGLMTFYFLRVCEHTYNMLVNNPLILAFVLMCSIFVGLALLKRLIHT